MAISGRRGQGDLAGALEAQTSPLPSFRFLGVTAGWRSPKGCVCLDGLGKGVLLGEREREGKSGPHPSRGQKEPTESSLERPACKKLLFFPNYEHFLTRGVKTQSSNLGLHQDRVLL